MEIEVAPVGPGHLEEYASLPISFEVRSVLECVVPQHGLGGIVFVERDLHVPYVKDYDAIPGEGPLLWPEQFDTSRWSLFLAREAGEVAGGAAVAFGSAGMAMLEGRGDLAVLWDIRVARASRRAGVGSALFAAACRWSADQGARELKVETQNTNVPACRFYESRGCRLGAVNLRACPLLPGEAQLLWYRSLASG